MATRNLTFVLPGLNRSGGYRTIIEWTNRLAADDVAVTIVSPTDGPARDWIDAAVSVRTAKPQRVLGRVHDVGRRLVGGREAFTLAPLMCAPLIPRRSAVISCFAPYSPRLLGTRPALTYMQHWESLWFDGDPKAQAVAERRMLAVDAGIVNSSWLRDHFPSATADRLSLVFPGVDTTTFTPGGGSTAPAGRPLRIAALGREVRFKGLADLREAAARLSGPVELHLFGTSDQREVDGPVREVHLGPLSQPDLADLYRSVDIVATPSHFESFPLPPIEAMACGAVVVTSRQGTEDYAVDGSNSYVFDGGDVDDLTKALERALTAPETMRQQARSTAERFTWENGYGMFREALDRHGVLPL